MVCGKFSKVSGESVKHDGYLMDEADNEDYLVWSQKAQEEVFSVLSPASFDA